MSEPKPLTGAELARHWGVSKALVSRFKAEKRMPPFTSREEADAWRAVNAPPRAKAGRPEADAVSPNGEGGVGKIADSFPTTGSGTEAKGAGEEGAEVIDVRTFIQRDRDFDVLMIEQAEDVPQIAYGLYVRACQKGNPSEISAANKNWHESAKAAKAVRDDFLELQERTRALIPVDLVMDIVGTELQAVRSAFLKLGERTANAANPADPACAKAAIDAAVDEIFRKLDAALERTAKELPGPAAAESKVLAS